MNEIIDFYENKYSEDERLKRHRLELIRTQEIISRYLKHGSNIIDIGGAAGVYSLEILTENRKHPRTLIIISHHCCGH